MILWSQPSIHILPKNFINELSGMHIFYDNPANRNKDIRVHHPECPHCDSKGNISLHRYLYWLYHPNDKIKHNEIIHHKNGNHQDNRIENLEKLNRNLHNKRHAKARTSKKRTNIYQMPRYLNGA